VGAENSSGPGHGGLLGPARAVLGAAVRHADGWMPVSARPSVQSRIDLLHAEVARQERDPASLSITVADISPDLESFCSLAAEGVERVLLSIPVGTRDETLRLLDAGPPWNARGPMWHRRPILLKPWNVPAA